MQLLKERAQINLRHASYEADLKVSARNVHETKEKQTCESEEAASTWGMFVQAIVGQRVETTDGSDVMKIALVSFPLPPGLEDKGEEIIQAAIKQNLSLGRLDGQTVHFNEEGTLLGNVMASQNVIDGSQLSVFSNLYTAAGLVVDKYRPNPQDEAVNHFNKFQLARNMRLDTLVGNVQNILSSAEHQNSSAWDLNFGGAFRQEWTLVNGKVMAPNPNNEITELTSNLANKDHDYGHSGWLSWIVDSINAAYNNGANSIIGFHVDGTVTVSSCGGSKGCSEFYEATMNQTLYGVDGKPILSYGLPAPNLILGGNSANSPGSSTSSNSSNSNNSTDSSSSGGGIDGSTTSITCTNCGRAMDKDQKVCSCRNRAAHSKSHR